MKPSTRTTLAVVLFLPLAAAILFTFACLPAPVGDPDKSKIDDKLTGAWINHDKDETVLAILRPYDQHTWFLRYLATKPNDTKVNALSYKAWLTTLADHTFITCETL